MSQPNFQLYYVATLKDLRHELSYQACIIVEQNVGIQDYLNNTTKKKNGKIFLQKPMYLSSSLKDQTFSI